MQARHPDHRLPITDHQLPELARSELAVLKVLWRHGRLSAREVHDRLGDTIDWAYSTTRTYMDRMTAKGLIGKRRYHGIYLFEPRISRPAGLAGVVRELAERVLDVDYAPIVSLIAEGADLTDEEIAELERLLEEAE